jgi:hypothetical protein
LPVQSRVRITPRSAAGGRVTRATRSAGAGRQPIQLPDPLAVEPMAGPSGRAPWRPSS